MSDKPKAQLAHVGLYCDDIEKMREFYTRILGFVVSDTGKLGDTTLMFMSLSPEEHHQFVLISPKPNPGSNINQISFRVPGLEDVRKFYRILKTEGAQIQRCTDHGNAWSVYFFDPEGNRLEIYTPSPWYVPQPFGEPLDLDASVDEIIETTKTLLATRSGVSSFGEWRERFRSRIQ